MVARNSAWIFFEKGSRMAMSLVFGVWTARYLGPSQYGELAYVVAFIAIFNAWVTLGADNYLVKMLVMERSNAATLIGTVMGIRFSLGIFSYFLALGYWYFQVDEAKDFTVLFYIALAGGVLIIQAVDTIELWFQSQNQNKLISISRITAFFIANLIRILLIVNAAPLWAFMLFTTIDSLFAAACLYLFLRNDLKGVKLKFSRVIAKGLFGKIWTFTISSAALGLLANIDKVILGNIAGSLDVGIYAAAIPLSVAWLILPHSISISIIPLLTKLKNSDQNQYYLTLHKYMRYFSIIGYGFILFILIFSSDIVGIIYGGKYSQASSVLKIYAFSTIFTALGLIQGIYISISDKKILNIFRTFLSIGTCILLNFILIPLYSEKGAAIAAIFSQAAFSLFSNLFFDRKFFLIQIKALLLIPLSKKL